MFAVILPLFWYGILVGIVLYVQERMHITYGRGWYIYIPLFMLGSGGLLLSTSLDVASYVWQWVGVGIGGSAILIFLILELWRGRRWSPDSYYGHATLPATYGDLLQPHGPDTGVKVTEILFQDVVAFTLVLGLLEYFALGTATVLFVGVVALTHLVGVWAFGRVYGGMLFLYATTLAGFVPWLLQITSLGFYVLFGLHLVMYPLMMAGMYWLGTKRDS